MKYLVEDTTLTNVANSIRTKEGSTESIKVGDFASKIANLPTGENLDAELNAQDTLLENQNTTIADIYDALQNKGENPYNAIINNEYPEYSSINYLVKEMPVMYLSDDTYQVSVFQNLPMVETTLKAVTSPNCNGVSLDYTCYSCRNVKKIDYSELYMNSLQTASFAFYSCYNLEELDISKLDFSNVTNTTWMFGGVGDDLPNGQKTKIYVKDKAAQDFILGLQGVDRPTSWGTDNVIIKGGN